MDHNDVGTAINRLEALFPDVEPALRLQFEERDPGDTLLNMCLSESKNDLLVVLHKAGYHVKSLYMRYLDRRLDEMSDLLAKLSGDDAKNVLGNLSFCLVLHDDEQTAKSAWRQIRVHAGEA